MENSIVKRKSWIVMVIVVLILLPLFGLLLYSLSGKRLDYRLENDYAIDYVVDCSFDSIKDKTFQESLIAWVENNLGLRGIVVRSYNEVQYLLFKEGIVVFGNHDELISEDYINAELGIASANFSRKENLAGLQDYFSHLDSVNKKLRALGIKLIVYTSANKASCKRELIPYRFLYRRKIECGDRQIDVFRTMIQDTDIEYLDTSNMLEHMNEDDYNAKWPIFYLSGVHWSRPAEQQVTVQLLNMMSEESEQNKVVLEELNESDVPYWRDADLAVLANIWTRLRDNSYYEYVMNNTDSTGTYHLGGILLQGGSFAEGFLKDYKGLNLGEINYVNYCTYIDKYNGGIAPISGFQDIDMRTILDKTNYVVIEINEAHILRYSDGFVEFLDEFLDEYA